MDPIKLIAAQITTDPDVLNEATMGTSTYSVDEVSMPPGLLPLEPSITTEPEYLGDIPADEGHGEYVGLPGEDEFANDLVSIDFVYDWEFNKGERRTRDYPGSPDYTAIIDVRVEGVMGSQGPIPLTPEVINWATEWFWDNEDEVRDSAAHSNEYDPDEREYDPDFDRDFRY